MQSSPRYIIYARKSSESEDRQVLSIASQIQELRSVANRGGIVVSEILTESRSAKAPGRPIFAQMMQLLEQRKASGILCWKLDRLARNPVDGGALIWALDQGTVSGIMTPARTFSNQGDDKFWMQLEFGMAKKYVDDLSDNVKRGNRAKLMRGWVTGRPPLGYANDRVARTIVPDLDRFDPIRRIWDMALSRVPLARILQTANHEWGFRTRKYRREGGGPLAQSTLYKLLSNPFYYGLIVRAGETFPGAHKPMISRDEYDRVQEFLGRPNRSPATHRAFAFTGLIRCGECGLGVTAEVKTNRQGHRYTYYHCTKRRSASNCRQKTIRAELLEEQVRRALQRITIRSRVLRWAGQHMDELRAADSEDRKRRQASVADALRECEARLGRLTDLRLRDLIGDEEYAAKRQELVDEQLRLRQLAQGGPATASKTWFEPAQHYLSFLAFAEKEFRLGATDDKRAILQTLGSNLILKDGILTVHAEKPFLWAEEARDIIAWQAIVERVRTFFAEHPDRIRWPSFCRQRTEPPESTNATDLMVPV